MDADVVFVRPQKAAEMLSVSPATMRRLIVSGAIPSTLHGRLRLIPVEAIQDWARAVTGEAR